MKWSISDSKHKKSIFGLTPVVSNILSSRVDFEDEEALGEFLNPSLSLLEMPNTLKNMEEAAREITSVIENGGKIIVHGDYDADGITSSVVLAKTLTELGAEDFTVWLPHRMLDGYGMSDRFVAKAIEEKPDLIITVDCGIAESKRISDLAKAGIKVVVTDHHKVPESGIPKDAVAVVDPKQEGESSAFTSFAGVGVSFKLSWLLCEMNKNKLSCKVSEFLKKLIPYVAIGTVADVMPLIGENRSIVHSGLKMIRTGNIDVGIKDLIKAANVNIDTMTSRDIGFMIAPRINSAGRMDDPSVAFRCFYCGDRSAASQLDMYNESRKEATEKVQKEAEKQIDEDDPIIVVAQERWHEGVLGIVAGKISEKYMRPAIVLSISSDIAKGSGRSVGGVDLHAVVSECSEHLERFGGHAQALGVALKQDKIKDFKDALRENAKRMKFATEATEPVIDIDALIEIGDINDGLMSDLQKLEPFGQANPEPIFGCKNVRLADMRTMGKGGRHFSVTALKDGKSARGVCFNAGDLIDLVESNLSSEFDIAFVPSYNTFGGRTSIQLMLKDVRISE
jgi:single-stranded-DNA-specific exonuclease